MRSMFTVFGATSAFMLVFSVPYMGVPLGLLPPLVILAIPVVIVGITVSFLSWVENIPLKEALRSLFRGRLNRNV